MEDKWLWPAIAFIAILIVVREAINWSTSVSFVVAILVAVIVYLIIYNRQNC